MVKHMDRRLMLLLLLSVLLFSFVLFGLDKNLDINNQTAQVYSNPSIFNHIKIYVSSSGPKNQEHFNWLRDHVDMGVAGSSLASPHIKSSLKYVNWSDISFNYFRHQLVQLSKLFSDSGRDMNEMFLHYKVDTKILAKDSGLLNTDSGVTKKSFREDKFPAVFKLSVATDGSFSATDVSYPVYGDSYTDSVPKTYNIKVVDKVGDQLLIGSFFVFDEVNFRFSVTADPAWQGLWEYWDGQGWKELIVNDGTNGMKNNGKLSFVVPSDWKKNIALKHGGYDMHMYWIRLTAKSGSVFPEVTSYEEYYSTYKWQGLSGIYGRSYRIVEEGGKEYFVIPGWNPSDPSNSSARFQHEAMAPSVYTMNRWVTNIKNDIYINYAVNNTKEELDKNKTKGILIDNIVGFIMDLKSGKGSYLEYSDNTDYARSTAVFLNQMKSGIDSSILGTNSGYDVPDEVVNNVDGVQWEGVLYGDSMIAKDKNLEYYRMISEKIRSIKSRGKYLVLTDSIINVGHDFYNNPEITRKRANIHSLARYYLVADDNTYLNFQDNSDYSHPWSEWFDAIEYDVGKPVGDVKLYKSAILGQNDLSSSQNILLNNSFETWSDSSKLQDNWASYHWGDSPVIAKAYTTDSRTGQKSIEVSANNIKNGGIYQKLPMKPNTEYTLTAWVKIKNINSDNNTCPIAVVANVGGGSSSVSGCAVNISVSDDWMPISKVFKTGSDTSGSFVYPLMVSGFTGSVLVDDVSLVEGNKAVSVANIFSRDYEKALILTRPLSERGKLKEPVAEITLPANYKSLNSDGSLSQATNMVSLRPYESKILIPVGGPTPAPTPLPDVTPTPTPPLLPDTTPTPTPPPGGTNGLCGITLNSCQAGSFSDIEDTSTKYNWSCLGINGGQTMNCNLDRFLPPINNNPPNTNRPTNTSTYRPGPISNKINYIAPTINIPTTTVDISMPELPSWLDFITAFVLDIANDIIRGVKRTGEMLGM